MIRRIATSCLLAAGALLAIPAAAYAQAEEIHAYDVRIVIQRDGSTLVTETIDYDFGSTEHHGIFREIPVRLPYDDRYDRVYALDVDRVEATGGASADFAIEHDGNLLRIKIGDPDSTISGRHTYTIVYTVRGALNAFADHDELYWNAIGDGWSVPIAAVTVTVTAPAHPSEATCFAGPAGSGLPCDGFDLGASDVTYRQDGLDPYEGLTVVVALPKGALATLRPILVERWSFGRAFAVTPLTSSVAGGLLVLLIGGLTALMWVQGRDRRVVGSAVDAAFASATTADPGQGEQAVPLFEHGATPVEFAPPAGIRPGQVGTLIDESANPLDVTATVVDLAVRGYLRIEEIPKHGWFGKPDWRLVQVREPDQDLLPYEASLLSGLFELSDDDDDDAPTDGLATVRLSKLKQRLSARLQKVENALYDDAVARGWFAGRPDKVRRMWHGVGAVVFLGGAGLTILAAAKSHLGILPIPVAIAGLALLWGAHLMPRRTPAGTGMVRRVFGFRTYIETAEARELRFDEKENIFARYLPYAIVFGCTEKWARAFSGLADQPQATGWYVGPHPFTVAAFASSIDHFSTATAGTIASTPSSSGGSGFGGGGFSGGGGGGGGGGSW